MGLVEVIGMLCVCVLDGISFNVFENIIGAKYLGFNQFRCGSNSIFVECLETRSWRRAGLVDTYPTCGV